MKSKSFTIPILDLKVKVYGGANPEWEQDDAIGMVWSEGNGLVIWIANPDDPSLVVHECFHLAKMAMAVTGVEDAEEWHACLLQYLFDQVNGSQKKMPREPLDPSVN